MRNACGSIQGDKVRKRGKLTSVAAAPIKERQSSAPQGWRELPSARPKWVQKAKKEGWVVKVSDGWRYGWEYFKHYAHPQAQEKFEVRVAEKEKDPKRVVAAQKGLETRRKRKREKNWADFEACLTQKVTNPNVLAVLRASAKRAGIKFARMAAERLLNVNKAHPVWLEEFLEAVNDNFSRQGIVFKWDRLRDVENELADESFYSVGCRALAAWRRHNLTNYDEALSELRTNRNRHDFAEEVAALRWVKTQEAKEKALAYSGSRIPAPAGDSAMDQGGPVGIFR